MKQFSELSKEDQELIYEATKIQTKAALEALKGNTIDTAGEFENVIQNMSMDAKEFLVEDLKKSIPEKYR